MKPSLQILTVILFSILSLTAFTAKAEKHVKYFEEIAQNPSFSYDYISPTMLHMMGDRYLYTYSESNLPISSKDLTMMEKISTQTDGQNEELWYAIRALKKEKKMETLTTKKSDRNRYDVLVTLTKDGKKILNMMMITQNGGYSVEVIYVEGKIPLDRIQNYVY